LLAAIFITINYDLFYGKLENLDTSIPCVDEKMFAIL